MQGKQLYIIAFLVAASFALAGPFPAIHIIGDNSAEPDKFIDLLETHATDLNIVAKENADFLIALDSERSCEQKTFYPYANKRLLDQQPSTHCTGLYIEPNPQQQLWLLKKLIPQAKRIGVILHPDNRWIEENLKKRVSSQQLFRFVYIDNEDVLPKQLSKLLPSVDALMLFPDERLFNSQTAKNLLLTSYRLSKPVIGPDDRFARAGSLGSVYLSKTDAAQKTVQAIQTWNQESSAPDAAFAAKSIYINKHVARTYGVAKNNSEELEAEMENVQ